MTSSPVTSSPVTSPPVTSSPVTSSPVTSSPSHVYIQQPSTSALNRFDLLIEDNLPPQVGCHGNNTMVTDVILQDIESYFKVCESLSVIVRDEQCIDRDNFTTCLRTVRYRICIVV